MALNDIIVPKEGASGVLTEIALTPADIGAASASHASTHHTGGADAIAPNNIGAAWALVLSSQFISGDTLLSAGRNRRITLSVVATANVDLPYGNNVNGDVVTLVKGITGGSTATIRKADALSGGVPIAYSTLATLNASDQSFTFVSDGTATGWTLQSVNTHAHVAADITSGTFDNARINFAAPASIGSTTPNSGSFTTLAANNGTLTASAPVLDLAQTWNNAAVAFTGLRFNATDTASNASSLLADFQTGGTSRVRFTKAGSVVASGSITAFNTYAFTENLTNNNITSPAVSGLTMRCTGGGSILMYGSGYGVQAITFSNTQNGGYVFSGASNFVDIASGVRIYNTNVSSTNFERLFHRYNSTATAFQIGTEKGSGGGLARDLTFLHDGTTRLTINDKIRTGSTSLVLGSASRLEWGGGTTYLEASTSASPAYFKIVTGSTDRLNFDASGIIGFGGLTSLFPALKRSSTTLQVRLADDSAFAPFTAGLITATGNLVITDNDGPQTATFDAQSKLTANRTYDLPDASGTIALLETLPAGGPTNLWIPASAWIPTTTNGCGVDSRELSTNKTNYDELLFDAGADEFAQALVVMPSNYNNGTVAARFFWTCNLTGQSGGSNVIWVLAGRAFSDIDVLDAAMGTSQSILDTVQDGDYINKLHISDLTSQMTLAGTPAANRPVLFQISRFATSFGDSLGADARLLGVEILFN